MRVDRDEDEGVVKAQKSRSESNVMASWSIKELFSKKI